MEERARTGARLRGRQQTTGNGSVRTGAREGEVARSARLRARCHRVDDAARCGRVAPRGHAAKRGAVVGQKKGRDQRQTNDERNKTGAKGGAAEGAVGGNACSGAQRRLPRAVRMDVAGREPSLVRAQDWLTKGVPKTHQQGRLLPPLLPPPPPSSALLGLRVRTSRQRRRAKPRWHGGQRTPRSSNPGRHSAASCGQGRSPPSRAKRLGGRPPSPLAGGTSSDPGRRHRLHLGASMATSRGDSVVAKVENAAMARAVPSPCRSALVTQRAVSGGHGGSVPIPACFSPGAQVSGRPRGLQISYC